MLHAFFRQARSGHGRVGISSVRICANGCRRQNIAHLLANPHFEMLRHANGTLMLTVLVSLYNDRNLVPTMLGLVCQALPDVEKEIIIVDDVSTDGSREWLRESFPDGA